MDGWFYGLVTAIKNILAWLCCLGVLCLKCPFKVIENITRAVPNVTFTDIF